jgi:hypothetical protein
VWLNSVLPAELEAKRRTIAKTHNRLVLALLGVLVVGLLVLAAAVPRDRSHKPTISDLIAGMVLFLPWKLMGSIASFDTTTTCAGKSDTCVRYVTSRSMNRGLQRGPRGSARNANRRLCRTGGNVTYPSRSTASSETGRSKTHSRGGLSGRRPW